MRKLLKLGLLSALLITARPILAEEIKVPVVWNRKNDWVVIKQLGFYRDDDKYVWAVKSEIFKNIDTKKRTQVCFYLNSDNNKDTGRFSGTAGYDLQFNILLSPVRSAYFMYWPTGTKRDSAIITYPDDYLVTITDDVLYLAIKKSVLAKYPIHDEYVLRILLNSKPIAVKVKSPAASAGAVMPPLNFTRYGQSRISRKKSSYMEIIDEKGGIVVWNSFMERYEPWEKLPEHNKKIKELSISAARGESESLQLGITSAEIPEKLNLSASDLVNAHGEKLSASQMEIKYVAYAIDKYGKSYGDVLLPSYKRENAANNFILLTVNVPADAKAGIYRGKLNLKVNDKLVSSLPLKLRVYDFALPATPSFITAFGIKSYITEFFKIAGRSISPGEVKSQIELMRQLCCKYKVGPRFLGAGPGLTIVEGKLKFDWTRFDKALEKFFTVRKFAGFQMDSRIQLGSHGKMYPVPPFFSKTHTPSVNDAVFQELWPQYVKAVYERLKRKNYLDRTLFVIWDEPYDNWEEIKILANLAKKGAPGIKLGIFIDHYEPRLAEFIDVWLTPAIYMAGIYKPGRKIWLYNDGRMGDFTGPASDVRSCFWQAWHYKLCGFLNSEINAWHWGCAKPFDKYHNLVPVHMWFYPDLDGSKPLPSLRLALIRDGVEDYEYLKLFADKLAAAKAKNHHGLKDAEKLQQELQKVMPVLNKHNTIDFKMDSITMLNKWRDKIAEQIISLSK
ncbi:MAG: glycoside hydrolase domain-containing protein [Victivallaceae bacterium]